MTKKHFIALADTIKQHNTGPYEQFTHGQILALAYFCQSQNPNFNRERWLDYIAGKCSKSGGKVKQTA